MNKLILTRHPVKKTVFSKLSKYYGYVMNFMLTIIYTWYWSTT